MPSSAWSAQLLSCRPALHIADIHIHPFALHAFPAGRSTVEMRGNSSSSSSSVGRRHSLGNRRIWTGDIPGVLQQARCCC
jgi:hypothetical protein